MEGHIYTSDDIAPAHPRVAYLGGVASGYPAISGEGLYMYRSVLDLPYFSNAYSRATDLYSEGEREREGSRG